MNPVVFLVSIRVKPGREEEFLRVLTPVLDAMRHEKSFINVVLHRSEDDPTHFMLYETWANFDDVKEVQLKRDYRQEYHARLDDLLEAPREVEFWQPVRADFAFFAGAS